MSKRQERVFVQMQAYRNVIPSAVNIDNDQEDKVESSYSSDWNSDQQYN